MSSLALRTRKPLIAALSLVLVVTAAGCDLTKAQVKELSGSRSANFLRVSTEPDRSTATTLDGSTRWGPLYIFLPSNVGVTPSKVEFFLDNPNMTGAATRVTTRSPYDFAGTTSDGTAQAWTAGRATRGSHKITARWTYASGATGFSTAAFTVGSTTPAEPAATTTTTAPPATTTTVAPTTTTVPPPASPGSGFTLSLPWFRSNTGPLTTPTKTRSGSFTSADAGKTFDGYVFSNGIQANGVDNVTIRNSVIRGRVAMGYGDATGWRFEQSEIDGSSVSNNQSTIGDGGFTFYRVNLHHGSNGVRWSGGITITESWIHDMYEDAAGSHRSCVGSNGGTSTTVIARNWIDCSSDVSGLSGTLVMYGDFGKIQNVTVEGNYLNGSGSYTTYAGSCSAKPYPLASNVKYLNNVFGPSQQYGYVSCWSSNGGSNVWSGNVDTSGKSV